MSKMTPKELSYIEDALSHECFMKEKCTDLASKLKDTELRDFVTGMANKHQQTFGALYQLLNQ